ncbi:regulatory LuxR family protein [Orenia metallireducens]|uniref:Regulatory protein, luxR family n=1 Tax=Orenia metallireducens TaxID=1413210 RepID=A0A285IBD9_9FIRM|nr:helix-turn-helix domain-containing protein [Orenia metallireducens]PRX20630.1 regulatory LuxR family protein [Orenia metallireducens]SNY45270.1 regulatory protein, luxR family [Orenia metallireducens]
MREKKEINNKTLESLGKCLKLGLKKDLSSPRIRLEENKLREELNKKKLLISIFRESINEINDCVDQNHIFLLINSQGFLLDVISKKLEDNCFLKAGISFAEDSIGTNAISLAMNLKEEIYLISEEHYCNFFKEWNCFALPIWIEGDIVGYIDISVIDSQMKDLQKGLIAFGLLLRENIIQKYKLNKEFKLLDGVLRVTKVQKEILKMTINGYTEQDIAEKLCCSNSAVKYHKKKIKNSLNTDNIFKAIIKAIKTGIISVEEFQL